LCCVSIWAIDLHHFTFNKRWRKWMH
jgi:hypothetical protein